MNVPPNSDSTLYPSPERMGATTPAGYAAVPISVYRELAAELKTTQNTVEALTRQNQQLVRQNKLLRNEIQRFVQAAEQLGHFAGVMPQEPPVMRQNLAMTVPMQEPSVPSMPANVPTAIQQASPQTALEPAAQPAPPPPEDIFVVPEVTAFPPNGAIVPQPKEHKRDRPQSPQPDAVKQRLFTEQPEEMRPLSKVSSRRDLGNLWLAMTIVIVVVTAFGAGFLIMRPLLRR